MRPRTSRTAVLTTVALAATLLAFTPPASAAPTWVDTPDIVGTGDQVRQLHASGTSLAWVDTANDDVVEAVRKPGEAWSAPIVLASPGATPRIEMTDGSTVYFRVGTSLRRVTLDPSTLAPTAPTEMTASYVPGTLASFGDLPTWAEDLGGGQQRIVAQNGSTLQVVRPAAAVTYREVVGGFAPGDHGQLAWVEEAAGGAQQLFTEHWNGQPALLGDTGSTYADLDFSSSGDLTWVQTTGATPARVRAAQVASDGVAWTAVDVPGGPGAAADPSVGRFANGGRVLVWREQDGGTWSVRSSTAPARGGKWAAAATLATGSGSLAPDTYSSGSGYTGQLASWCRPDTTGCTMQGAFRAPGSAGAWGAVTDLGTVADAADARLGRLADESSPTAWTGAGDDIRISVNDHTAPVTTSQGSTAVALDNVLPATWSAVDDWSAVASYRLQVADVGPRDDSGRLSWRDASAATTATERKLRVARGATRCYRVFATDAVGNAESGADEHCTTAPLDDRDLRRSTGWEAVSDAKSYRSTLMRTKQRGAKLAYSNYPFNSVKLLFRRFPRGGTVEILLSGQHVRTLSTAGAAMREVALPASRPDLGNRDRILQIRVVSKGRLVLIDGVIPPTNPQR
ncbi:hypothetical protein ASC77_10460 [Nocardioides sp. Root1257]|uniref:hypothetical protein n=1 Tax=unclassified Nocardioides TaxID=2615069 RepID=UPI0006FC2761|nr:MULTISPECIES: hypothetical protein [unclassified Nocardioides]KQW49113.1 hypothetical protein ASC77_10460 [Nocardioides sp. Root1257]KRC48287.1 hypothetical protein ASE24_10465 [Nocardioides sp. Root224]